MSTIFEKLSLALRLDYNISCESFENCILRYGLLTLVTFNNVFQQYYNTEFDIGF